MKILRFFKYCLKTWLKKRGGGFFFLFSFSFIQVFYFAKVVSFFCWKKPHIIYIGNKKTPFSTNQGFFLSKKKLCWKTIKILKHFLSQKLTQFFTFFSTRHFRLKNIYNFQTLLSRKHFTLKILRFSKYCLKTQFALRKRGFSNVYYNWPLIILS